MKWLYILILTFSSSIVFGRHSCTDEEFSRAVSKKLPKGAGSIISRIVQCNHWGGEVGDSDPERKKQIEAGVNKAKCEALEKDRSEFIKHHSKNKKIEAAFVTADSWEGLCD